ncbi:MAG TPA: hypothetical protein IGR64_02565 [Leptolyngbyaceae cyanobacterium M65_K2018_010]|nr:hypothetical protein [Leptolyngbyaceae cyanobacterium M65_K2018_010]
MKTRNSDVWTTKSLTHFSYLLGEGYVPGMGANQTGDRDRWTPQRYCRVSMIAGHGYNPGL